MYIQSWKGYEDSADALGHRDDCCSTPASPRAHGSHVVITLQRKGRLSNGVHLPGISRRLLSSIVLDHAV